MPAKYADNAISAKVHSLYGRRLTDHDYNQLLQKKNVGEVAAYLKRETIYGDCLNEVKDDLIHRGQLENLVRKHALDIHLRLTRYSPKDDIFSLLYATRKEIEQLLFALRMLSSGSMGKYITSFPLYLDKYLSLDLVELARIKDYDQLLQVVKHTDYHQLLGSFRPISSSREIDITGCETVLLTYYYNMAMGLARKHSKGDAYKELLTLFQARIDRHNITLIYRLKRYFKLNPQEIAPKLIDIKGNVSQRSMERILTAGTVAQTTDEIYKVCGNRRSGKQGTESIEVEWSLEEQLHSICHKTFRFSNAPTVVLFSYMWMLDMEIHNIVNIIEGTRYQVPYDEIRELLIM